MTKPRVPSGRRSHSVENLFRGFAPAHRVGALTPAQGTLAFSSPGCHVLSSTGPFLMPRLINHNLGCRSMRFCVINGRANFPARKLRLGPPTQVGRAFGDSTYSRTTLAQQQQSAAQITAKSKRQRDPPKIGAGKTPRAGSTTELLRRF